MITVSCFLSAGRRQSPHVTFLMPRCNNTKVQGLFIVHYLVFGVTQQQRMGQKVFNTLYSLSISLMVFFCFFFLPSALFKKWSTLSKRVDSTVMDLLFHQLMHRRSQKGFLLKRFLGGNVRLQSGGPLLNFFLSFGELGFKGFSSTWIFSLSNDRPVYIPLRWQKIIPRPRISSKKLASQTKNKSAKTVISDLSDSTASSFLMVPCPCCSA